MTNSSKIPCIAADIQTLQSPPRREREREKEREAVGVKEREREKQDYYSTCLLLRPFIADNGGGELGHAQGRAVLVVRV